MDAADRLSLVAAAATCLGPVEDPSTFATQVRERAVELYLMSRERGTVRPDPGAAGRVPHLCRHDSRREGGAPCLVDGRELRRGLVRLKVASSKYNRDGVEEIRTELLHTDAGAVLWARIRGLVGHRVLVYAQTGDKDSREVKTLRHLEDLGEDPGSPQDEAA